MSLPWSEKGTKADPVVNDEIMILDSEDTDPETINKRVTLGSIPSAGETNTASNIGGGREVFAQKDGVDFEFRTLFGETNKLVLTENDDNITFTLGSLVVTTDNENFYEAGKTQNFLASSTLAGININSQVPSTTDMGDIWRNNNIINFHDEDDNIQSIVTESVIQVLTNKTIDADNNSISNLELGMEVTGASADLTDGSNIALLDQLNDFTAGTQSLFFVSETADPALNGTFRMANTDFIAWKDGLASGDLTLAVNSSDFLLFDSSFVPFTTTQGTINQVLSSNGAGFAASFKDVTDTVFPVPDNVMIIADNADPSIEIKFELASLSSGFQRVITPADADITLVDTLNGFITDSNLTAGSFPSITGVGTLVSGTWQADIITVPFGGTGVDTLTAAGVLFGNGTSAITSNAVPSGSILFGNLGDATIGAMSGDATIDNAGVVTVLIASTDLTDTANLARVSTANTFAAFLQDFTSATMRIPFSATPTITIDGDFAIDSTVTDFSHGIIEYFATEELGVVSMPIAEFTSPVDGDVITYNATNDEFELATPVVPILPKATTQIRDSAGITVAGTGGGTYDVIGGTAWTTPAGGGANVEFTTTVAGLLTYTGTTTKLFKIDYFVSMDDNTGGADALSMGLFIGGSNDTASNIIAPPMLVDIFIGSKTFVVSLAQNDTVQLAIANQDVAGDIIVYDAGITITEFH